MIPRYGSLCSLRGIFYNEKNRDFETLTEAKHVFFFSSCRGSMMYALKALGIKKGDEVILPAFICNVVPDSLTRFGIKPVFVDVYKDPENIGNICIEKIESKVTKKTKAIIPVHLYGNPYESNKLKKLAKERDLFVIEDAAQALGAEYKGMSVGSLGDVSCFSFGFGKPMSTGGGCVATNNEDIYKKMKDVIADVKKPGFFDDIGFIISLTSRKFLMNKKIYGSTYRIWKEFGRKIESVNEMDFRGGSTLNEKLFRFQIKGFKQVLDTRRSQFKILKDSLSDINDIVLPEERNGVKHSALWFSFYHKSFMGSKRENFLERMRKFGIDIGIIYPFISPAFYNEKNTDYPCADMLSKSIMSLQMGPHLNENDINHISSALRRMLNES